MSVKSVMRVMEILELLMNYPEGLTLKEISDALSAPHSSVFYLIQMMMQRTFLTQTREKKYKLGSKLIQIGSRTLLFHTNKVVHIVNSNNVSNHISSNLGNLGI